MADEQVSVPHIDSYNIAMLQAIGTLAGTKPFHEYSASEQRELFSRVQAERPGNPGVSVSELRVTTSLGEGFLDVEWLMILKSTRSRSHQPRVIR